MHSPSLILLLIFFTTNILQAQNFDITGITELKQLQVETKIRPIIAIIDAGVNTKHSSITSNLWRNNEEISEDGIDNDNNGYIDDLWGWNYRLSTNDISNNDIGSWHGTPINGLIAASDGKNRGICEDCLVMNFVLNDSIESVYKALDYIHNKRKKFNESNGEEGAYVIAVNCSFGRKFTDINDFPDWCNYIDKIGNEGVLYISSVPNISYDIDKYGDMPTKCCSSTLITVTNFDTHSLTLSNSGYGKNSVDIAAPGDRTIAISNENSEEEELYGTSIAAPYISGTLGLFHCISPEQLIKSSISTPHEHALIMKEAILLSTTSYPSLKDKISSGGVLNAINSFKYLIDRFDLNVTVPESKNKCNLLSAYPNPTKHDCTIIVDSDVNNKSNLIILSANGKLIHSKDIDLKTGLNSFQLYFKELPSGMYLILINSPFFSNTLKVIKHL